MRDIEDCEQLSKVQILEEIKCRVHMLGTLPNNNIVLQQEINQLWKLLEHGNKPMV